MSQNYETIGKELSELGINFWFGVGPCCCSCFDIPAEVMDTSTPYAVAYVLGQYVENNNALWVEADDYRSGIYADSNGVIYNDYEELDNYGKSIPYATKTDLIHSLNVVVSEDEVATVRSVFEDAGHKVVTYDNFLKVTILN